MRCALGAATAVCPELLLSHSDLDPCESVASLGAQLQGPQTVKVEMFVYGGLRESKCRTPL